MYKGEGKTHSGWKQPYAIWSWKQRELFRNIQEAQFEHMRKIYKRQWYEGYRVNASEYIYKYNITKAAQLVQWENEMEAQEQKRREAYQMAAGRKALKEKHLDLLREYHEKEFFHWYERASDRLQYMSQTMKFLDRTEVDNHIDAELNKYIYEPGRSYPLNFAGQMPLLEDDDGNVVAAGNNQYTRAQHEFPDIKRYDAPVVGEEESQALARSISANLRSLDSVGSEEDGGVSAAAVSTSTNEFDDAVAAQVADQMAQEQQEAFDEDKLDEDRVTNMDEETYERKRRQYLDRGKTGSKRGSVRALKGGAAQSGQLETIMDTDTTLDASEKKMKEATAEELNKRKKNKKASREQQAREKQKLQDLAQSRLDEASHDQELKTIIKKSVDEATAQRDLDPANRTKGTVAKPQKLIKPKISQELIDRMIKTGIDITKKADVKDADRKFQQKKHDDDK